MMARLMGLFTIVPTTVLLTISLFVLLALRKVEQAGIKAFGYVVAALLWVSALLVFSSGIYTLSTGRCPMKEMMKCHRMQQGMMQQGQMPPMPMMQGQAKK